MAAIGMDAERKLRSHLVCKINRVLLSVPVINVYISCPGGVIDGRVLEAVHLPSGENVLEEKKRHINLDTVAGHFFLVASKRF